MKKKDHKEHGVVTHTLILKKQLDDGFLLKIENTNNEFFLWNEQVEWLHSKI